ncbi:MAG: hypothetical protein LBC71_03135 [Oscillospiraceae bacterium]|nr:hypothetical protein [Oscillospiraceae bacterium]
MIILDSARKHGISDNDILKVVKEPKLVYIIRPEPEKTLILGFDTKVRVIEIVTDTMADGQLCVIHADKITKKYEKLLEETLC